MKNNGRVTPQFALVFILLLQFCGGCSDIGTEVDPAVVEISGSWTWVRSEGGMSIQFYFPPVRTIVKDTYSTHGSFSRERNDTLIVSSQYSISRTQFGALLTYTNNTSLSLYMPLFLHQYVHIEGDTLRLDDDGGDAFQHVFVRARQ